MTTLGWVEDFDLRAIYRTTKKNAPRRGIPFEITFDEMVGLFARSEGRCELTGIAFTNERRTKHKRPYAPILDRIDSRLGYTAANCRIVCVAANLAMNEFGEEVLREVAVGLLGGATKYSAPYDPKSPNRMPEGIRARTRGGKTRFMALYWKNGAQRSAGTFDFIGDALAARKRVLLQNGTIRSRNKTRAEIDQ